jgi:hypothetical protein
MGGGPDGLAGNLYVDHRYADIGITEVFDFASGRRPSNFPDLLILKSAVETRF